ncbi:regulatory particle non-ATPase 10 isoform X1 [Tachypleus tridentatus]|uniref:regulatory particle non-ATPase 10 isoform X1 n=1 Tax=Tachypleus tridentatus TaxID=6853 RepID=UPI003FD1A718
MVLESTMVCVDNSEYMRNGDFVPTRMQVQQEAVNLICHSKTRSNPENNVGLLTLASPEVLATLTTDVGRILTKFHQLQPKGSINFLSGVRIAHLALKHRQGKNHKMRIIVFVGSPVEVDTKELVKVAKRLKKEKVNVDIINFGEDTVNTEKLTSFINAINGKEGGSSHLVTVPPGPHLMDALISSPVVQGEDGTGAVNIGGSGFEFGVDPNEDPELALALRVSMEEQRQRQEDEAKKASTQSAMEIEGSQSAPTPATGSNEETLLEKALAMSLESEGTQGTGTTSVPDFSAMTEEEQIAYAMQMSLQQAGEGGEHSVKTEIKEEPMETSDGQPKKEEEDYSEVMNDPEFLQSVLENLPGVDPQSDAIRSAMGTLTQSDQKKSKKEDKDDKK